MYSSYTTLQRAQLAKQEYLDTQEVFLGVYAPGRNAALKASLQDQLHRKFLLTDSLRPEALGSAAGVLLVREDLFLMSTALSCFADALHSGADYVTSDAVFGYSGVTTLYHSQGFAACPGCALVSRELLRRCQAEARDPENPVELLTLAAQYGGSNLYIPKVDALTRTARDRLIREKFTGYNAEQLAQEFDLTVRWVQEICKDAPPAGQLSLLDFE